jgi:hypothetical protein
VQEHKLFSRQTAERANDDNESQTKQMNYNGEEDLVVLRNGKRVLMRTDGSKRANSSNIKEVATADTSTSHHRRGFGNNTISVCP